MTHSARAKDALAYLGEVDPALAVLSLWCRHRDTEGRTRTQGNTIYYGPSFMSFGRAEQVGVVTHHVLHVALQHSDRQAALAERLGEGFQPDLFGLAADGLINETLLLAGHALPRPAVLVTELLAAVGKPAQSAVSALSEWDVDRLALLLHARPQRAEKARKFGQQKGFERDLQSGTSDRADKAPTAADWRNQLVRALEAGRKAGTGIGQFGGILADLKSPGIAWEVQLRGLLAKALSDAPQVSHRRPAGRWAAMASQARAAGTLEPVFQPGKARNAERPRIVVGVDTSSSIEPLTLSLFCNEAEGVSNRTGAEAHLLAFDEEVHEVRRLDVRGWGSLRGLPLRTGGGTDYGPLMKAAAQLKPSAVVVLTDLDAPFGPPPAFPVIWAVPGRSAPKVPFGRVVMIEN